LASQNRCFLNPLSLTAERHNGDSTSKEATTTERYKNGKQATFVHIALGGKNRSKIEPDQGNFDIMAAGLTGLGG
jgi:hypothetical protein